MSLADAELCKGSTTDSDSVCEGSNPSPAAKQKATAKAVAFCFRFLYWNGQGGEAAPVDGFLRNSTAYVNGYAVLFPS